MPLRFSLLAVLLAVLVGSGTARGGTATLVGDVVRYEGAAGETNRVIVVQATAGYRILDPTAQVLAGAGCSAMNTHEAFCATRARVTILVAAGDLNDLVKVSADWYRIARLRGGPGADDLEGGLGENLLDGGLGADTFRNVPFATDVADYSSRSDPVYVTSGDGQANDGAPGERDRVPRGLQIYGGRADDVVTILGGSEDEAATSRGGPGDDRITTSHRYSYVVGGPGNDTLRAAERAVAIDLSGSGGRDTLHAGNSSFLNGGLGADRLVDRSGRADFLSGGSGPDVLLSRDRARDFVSGGDGIDRARVDARVDRVRRVERFF